MAGHSERWRFANDVATQRAAGWSLREQLLWRARELNAEGEVDLAAHIEHFPELVDGFSVDGIGPVLRARGREGELISRVSVQNGGSVRLTGMLRSGRDYAGFFMRHLVFERNWALHERLVMESTFRGQAIGVRFVHRSLSLYDELELEQVRIRAGLKTGRWLWGQLGFEFALQAEAEQAFEWAAEVCEALEVEVEGLDEMESAPQLSRLECEREVSFAAMAMAMPEKQEELEILAAVNNIALEKAIPLGQLVMLTGEEWWGYLNLQGGQRHAFEGAVAERVARAAEGT